MPKAKITSFVIAYYALIGIAAIPCVYFLGINIIEFKNRSSGISTYFSQRTWLSNQQSMLYLGSWVLVLGILLIGLVSNHLKQRWVKALVFAGIIILLLLCSFFIDNLFYLAPL